MPDETPTPHRYGLWKFFHDEHGLLLTVSELDEIEREVLKSNDEDKVNDAKREVTP